MAKKTKKTKKTPVERTRATITVANHTANEAQLKALKALLDELKPRVLATVGATGKDSVVSVAKSHGYRQSRVKARP